MIAPMFVAITRNLAIIHLDRNSNCILEIVRSTYSNNP